MSQQVAIKNFCIANRNASKRLDYIITAGQRPAVVHVPPHVLEEGDAVNLASLATTARLCAQRSASKTPTLLCTIRPHKCCHVRGRR